MTSVERGFINALLDRIEDLARERDRLAASSDGWESQALASQRAKEAAERQLALAEEANRLLRKDHESEAQRARDLRANSGELKAKVASLGQSLAEACRDRDKLRERVAELEASAATAWRQPPAPADKPCVVAYRYGNEEEVAIDVCRGGFSQGCFPNTVVHGWLPLPPPPTEPVTEQACIPGEPGDYELMAWGLHRKEYPFVEAINDGLEVYSGKWGNIVRIPLLVAGTSEMPPDARAMLLDAWRAEKRKEVAP